MKTFLIVLALCAYVAGICCWVAFGTMSYHYIAEDLTREDVIEMNSWGDSEKVWLKDVKGIGRDMWHITLKARQQGGINDINLVLLQNDYEFYSIYGD